MLSAPRRSSDRVTRTGLPPPPHTHAEREKLCKKWGPPSSPLQFITLPLGKMAPCGCLRLAALRTGTTVQGPKITHAPFSFCDSCSCCSLSLSH